VYKYVNIYINVSECSSASTHATPTKIVLVETSLQGDRTFRPVHATVYINSESVNCQLPAHKPHPTNTHRLKQKNHKYRIRTTIFTLGPSSQCGPHYRTNKSAYFGYTTPWV